MYFYTSKCYCMKRIRLTSGLLAAVSLFACAFAALAQNPYLPLWEHLPDGEPRVFEDPDNPGKYRAYIIGSHDITYSAYCGNDVRMWSAPVEDLSQWRDEGPIFTWYVDGQWDTMYAPDLVEVKDKNTGKKTYYLYPHSRGRGRIGLVCRSDRPDGPFVPVNATPDGRGCLEGSLIDFDPSVFIEPVTNKKDPDFARGYRAYVYYGFQHSTACELDPDTMYSMRPGTELHDYFIPASARYGVVRDPEGTEYPALYKGQNPGDFNFFEASSIRQVGNKYVMVFSGYSGPDYGLESTNSALRYAYGDSPLGPWRSGGVLVDSRGVVPDENGEHLMTSNAGHNTHGSIQEINGQWYVFYHRPPRGFGNARQAMVAPVKIEWDKKKVADGGQVRITAYDPYAPDEKWVAAAADGMVYTGAEVTSEGFQIYGLPPYRYYSAGYACFMTDQNWLQDNHDVWNNSMDLAGIRNGGIVGFKYFGFGGLAKDSKGVKAFEGVRPGDGATLNLDLTITGPDPFDIRILLDDPWHGRQIGSLHVDPIVPLDGPGNIYVELRSTYQVPVPDVEGLSGKHAIYLVTEGPDLPEPQQPRFPGYQPQQPQRPHGLYDLHGIGFSKQGGTCERPLVPSVSISCDGKLLNVPATPIRCSNANGLTDQIRYQVYAPLREGSVLTVKPSDPSVKVEISPIVEGRATITCTWHGLKKIYLVN